MNPHRFLRARRCLETGLNDIRQRSRKRADRPLDDLTLRHQQVPEVPISSGVAPYGTTMLKTCEAIGDETTALDDALGPDVDQARHEVSAADQMANAAEASDRCLVFGGLPDVPLIPQGGRPAVSLVGWPDRIVGTSPCGSAERIFRWRVNEPLCTPEVRLQNQAGSA